MTNRSMICVSCAALLCLAACSNDEPPLRCGEPPSPCSETEPSASASTKACEPFAGDEVAIALENPVAIGRDSERVIYVIDDVPDKELRAFISLGGDLIRHRVLGSGTGKDGDVWSYRATVEADQPLTLDARIEGSAITFTKLPTRDDDKTSLEGGEPLEVLSERDIEDMNVRNLAPEIEIEYFAAIEDGRFAVVARPRDDWSYEDFRLFLGSAEEMLERPVQSVVRARDGGSTAIDFTLDGEPAELHFPVMIETGPGPATLVEGGMTLDVERLDDAPEMAADFAYYCL